MDTALPATLTDRLSALYAEPHRRYHTLAHVQALLGWLRQYRHLAQVPADIEAAIWFHDAVYDTQRQDNEALSAELAEAQLQATGWPQERASRVADMVRATQHHRADEDDTDTQLFLDLDLSVLAAPAPGYAAYASAIRAEFGWVADGPYRAGRKRVLQSFLGRDHIYRTPALRAAWEAAARHNLQDELARLGAAPPST